MKKIGIFSGTFDPVHNGHVQFAKETLQQCGLDKIFFLVEPRPRRKQGVKAFEHRVKMVQLAISDEPKMASIVLEQARFTPHETLPLLQARFKGAKLVMLMGEDMLDHLADWPHVAELIDAVQFVIGLRRRTYQEVDDMLKGLQRTRGLKLNYTLFQAGESSVASSKVRLSLRKNQPTSAINPNVAEYIRRNGLYSTSGE